MECLFKGLERKVKEDENKTGKMRIGTDIK